MVRIARDFYARTPEMQELVICNLPWCCRHPPTSIKEYEEGNRIYFEYKCLECGRIRRTGFRLDLSDVH